MLVDRTGHDEVREGRAAGGVGEVGAAGGERLVHDDAARRLKGGKRGAGAPGPGARTNKREYLNRPAA